MNDKLEQDKQLLFKRLQGAIELELSTLPPYIVAACSIQPGANREAAQIIHSVFMEEMLHLVLAGNVLTAVGGGARLGEANVPEYPLTLKFDGQAFRDREFEVPLARLSPESVAIFKRIEEPADWHEGPMSFGIGEIEVEGPTIGEFYELIQKQLLQMCSDHGEAAVFSGDPAHQIIEQYYWYGGGKPLAVNNLGTATKALQVIIDQGEGASGSISDGDVDFGQDAEVAHFFRFNEIAMGRRYRPGDKPRDPPSGEELKVDYDAVWPLKPNPKASDYAEDRLLHDLNCEFNYEYSLMLLQIQEAMNGEPKVLYTAIKNGMHRLAVIARDMMSRPISGDPEGRHGCPSFEWVEPPLG